MDFHEVVLIFTVVGLTSCHPPGHLKPLGAHIIPEVNIPTIDNFPSPSEFYEKYVKPGRPVLIKKVLENGDIPAYHRWTDEYMAKNYGDERVDVELGKKEDRKYGGLITLKLSKFLERYKNMDAYMVHDLPKSMQKDFYLPVSIKCGGFQRVIRSLVTWFSSGSTKSHLHNDNLDNINCLLDGKKDLVLIDKAYSDLIEADGYNFDGSYSNVDVESVDMYKFPKLQEIPWYQVNLTKGDCFFIPYRWYHHVYSHPGRNFAVNVWFYHRWWFDKEDCDTQNENQAATVPMSQFPKTLKVEEYRQEILEPFKDKDFVSRKEFVESFKEQGFTGNADEVFRKFDLNNDNQLSWKELYSFGDEVFLTDFGDFILQLGPDYNEDDSPESEKLTENADELIVDGEEQLNEEKENENIESLNNENKHENNGAKQDIINNESGDNKRIEL